ncbi:T9SS type A sorting domain-containing protein [Flavivirga sp. 57AJ16]|uniref:T9SS type A sorting domain-containing protein n=1 Tax=Flavivirga sp. 57AJ16 TaxID=3025307 RepID=UPI0023662AF1|nr:T9SS type A sorting domain-containing protein [Flavivirga sp. 57AJ16]MDD7885371.1 T9SS type A sorting domain-containing protein [Flavivirga sp. 57AJ16]
MKLKIFKNESFLKVFFSLMLISCSALGFAQTYEFESGTLTGFAYVDSCPSCSGNMVSYVGFESTASFAVNVATEGWYNLDLTYCTADPRIVRLKPGSGSTIVIPCEPSGGWTTPASKNIQVYLNAGSTNLVWENENGFAPNLDKFELTVVGAPSLQTINFGANNSVVYDLTNKTYDVLFDGEIVVNNASAYAFSNQEYYSTNYASSTYTSEAFTDNLGSGTKHIFTLSGNYSLGMQQVFYVYDSEDYLVTQVILTGTGSNCYKMSPLTSNQVTPNFGTGDTRAVFVPYDNDEWITYNAYVLQYADFTASEVTNIYNNTNRNGLVIGSLDRSQWKTGIDVYGGDATSAYVSVIAGWTDSNITHDGRGHGWVNVGQTSCPSPKVIINSNDDWRTAFEEFGSASAAIQPKYVFDWVDPKPFGWNSWAAYGTTLDYAKSTAVVDFFSDDCSSFRSEDNTLFIDLDSYWDNMTDAQLAQFVTYANSKGFKAGIYWAPLVDWGKWDRQVEGSFYSYAAIWTKINGQPFERSGAYAVDPTHPGTKDRMKFYIDRFKAAGFEMLKIDFLTHGSLEADSYYNTSIHTGMEAYHEGMQYLIDEIGNSMLVEAAICPNLSTGPYAHMRRIACDTYRQGNYQDTEYQLNSATYGWWQNQIYDYLDSDAVFFGNTSIEENRARLLASVVIGTVTAGDDYYTNGVWHTKSIDLYQNDDVLDVARAEVNFIPAEGNTSISASNIFYGTKDNTTYVAVFNYGSTSMNNDIELSRLGLNSGDYTVKELFSGTTGNAQGTLSVSIAPRDAVFYAVTSESLSVSDQDEALNNSYVFPSPATTNVRIKFSNEIQGPIKLSMYDLSGKEIMNTIFNAEGLLSPEIPVNKLQTGIYFIKVLTSENISQNFKYIKQ